MSCLTSSTSAGPHLPHAAERNYRSSTVSLLLLWSSSHPQKKKVGSSKSSQPSSYTWMQQAFKIHLDSFSPFRFDSFLPPFIPSPSFERGPAICSPHLESRDRVNPELLLQTRTTMKYILSMTAQSLSEYIGVNKANISQLC